MTNLLLFNKPFGVISQFREKSDVTTLAEFIKLPKFYPAGRLDLESEGLLLLTNDGKLQAHIAEPRYKLEKTYWVQVEGEITDKAILSLQQGVVLKDGLSKPAKVKKLQESPLPIRTPPIRFRANIPTSWLEMGITEGRNRQIRRMTAKVGFPTLRLFRNQIGPWLVDNIPIGEYKRLQVTLPNGKGEEREKSQASRSKSRTPKSRTL
jgi:23S rRNA pseudouridine2457 synthase